MAWWLTQKLRRLFNSELRQEIRLLMRIAWPVVTTYFLNFIILSESMIMCGHLGKLELDGAALANSIINGFGLSFGSGLVTACDTLFSQCYGSAHKKRVGLYLQQSLLIIGQVPLLIWPLYINILPVFRALGQNEEVSRLAADYMLYFSPGLFFYYMYMVQARYLQNQDKVLVPMLVALVANVFNVVSQYLGIYVWNLGFLCSAVCQCLTYVVMATVMLAYILISGVYKETWDGWKVECLYNWWQFLKLAIPGMGMVSLEVMCWEIGTFIAGIIGTSELGAQSILFQTETLAYMCILGTSVAVNIRVGQHLGASQAAGAKTAWHAGLCCLACTATLLCAIFIIGKDFIPAIYTTDPGVLAITGQIFPLLGFFLYLDGLASVCAGALRGCGRQLTGVAFVFLSYYVLGMSIGVPLALSTSLHVIGLWIGLLIGVSIICPAYIFVLSRQDWGRQARHAQRRVRAASEKQLMYDTDCGEAPAPAAAAAVEAATTEATGENTCLLSDGSGGAGQRHRRYPSNPAYAPAGRLVPIRSPVGAGSRPALRRAVAGRVASAACVFAIFLTGLLLRLTVNSGDPWLPDGNSTWPNVTARASSSGAVELPPWSG